jgi:hypothetical protein
MKIPSEARPQHPFAFTFVFAALLSGATLVEACGGSGPHVQGPPPVAPDTPSTKAETKSDPSFAPCHQSFKPSSSDQDVASDVGAMAKGCADATKMTKSGDTLSGELREKMPPMTFPLGAQAGKCYRVYGISQTTMQDFDIMVVDSTGALVAQDTTDDVSPVVLEDGKFCFKVSDAATIRASAGAGGGKFALEVWSD